MFFLACVLSQGSVAAAPGENASLEKPNSPATPVKFTNGERPVPVPKAMQAAAIDRAGDSSVPTLHTVPVPKPSADEVLIAVHTAGVGIWDISVRRHPEGIKHSSFPLVLGTDGAGIVALI
jgi:hypothetical protein